MTAALVAAMTATTRTTVTDSSNIAWAVSALAPCSIIKRANVSAPTTSTPRVTIPTPRAVVAIAAAAIRKPTFRVQPGRLTRVISSPRERMRPIG